MDREELDLAVEGSCREYYNYLINNDEFKRVISKVDSDEKLNDDEWLYILERLSIVSYKSLQEEEKVEFADKFYSLVCRIGMRVFKNNSHMYNECLKMFKLIEFMKNRVEIDKDLYLGYDIVDDNRDENSLAILIKQHMEANIFRNNSEYYSDCFEESLAGSISSKDRVSMNATTYSYQREKELVKKYKDVI